jgi:SAM-dependent methyltransferase
MREVVNFVTANLPHSPARILEVGCGTGDLARVLAEQGNSLIAIDPEAPVGPIFRRTLLEEFTDEQLFDAVVANRSLHHVHDLAGGLDRILTAMRTGGTLIVNEFAWDRMDAVTARWYLSMKTEPSPDDASLLPNNFPHAWIEEHKDHHDSKKMLQLLDGRFQREFFEWVPYIAEHYLERQDLVAEEEALGHGGQISLIGFRYVGTPE